MESHWPAFASLSHWQQFFPRVLSSCAAAGYAVPTVLAGSCVESLYQYVRYLFIDSAYAAAMLQPLLAFSHEATPTGAARCKQLGTQKLYLAWKRARAPGVTRSALHAAFKAAEASFHKVNFALMLALQWSSGTASQPLAAASSLTMQCCGSASWPLGSAHSTKRAFPASGLALGAMRRAACWLTCAPCCAQAPQSCKQCWTPCQRLLSQCRGASESVRRQQQREEGQGRKEVIGR